MLSEFRIKENKEKFCDLLRGIERDGCDVEALIGWLEDSDFFTAPASTKYHCSFPGGLCEHSLNVYYALSHLNTAFIPNTEVSEPYSEESILIVGLLHDLNKVNFYEEYIKNEKVYRQYGKKFDEMGNFDWVATRGYKVKEASDRKALGTKGNISYTIAAYFLTLKTEEMMALMYQYSAVDKEPYADLSEILARYNLSVLLHAADIIATYCMEKENDKQVD